MQQVNLLDALPKQDSTSTLTNNLFTALIVIVSLLSFIFLYNMSMLIIEKNQLKKLQFQQQRAQIKLQTMAGREPQAFQNEELKQKIATLTDSIQKDQYLLTQLTDPGKRLGFSAYLKAFSLHTPIGIWFNRLQFNHNSKKFTLLGNSLQPLLVPRLLENIKQNQALANQQFNVIYLQRTDKPYISFTLSTEAVTPQESEEQLVAGNKQ